MSRRLRILLLVLAALPPLAAAGWTLLAAVNAPDPDTWGHLWSEDALRTAAGHRLSFEGEPRFVTFRLAYHGLLAIPGIDFAHLAWAAFALALLTWVMITRSSRGDRGIPSTRGSRGAGPNRPWVALGLALLLFSPAFGADWLQGERARFMVPGFAFAAAALWLTRSGRLLPGFLGAALLASLALTTTAHGIAVWFALIPLIAVAAARRPAARPGRWVALWIVLGNLAALLTYHQAAGWAHTTPSPLVEALLREPWTAATALLHAAGAALPGASMLPAEVRVWAGAALLAAAVTALLAILARPRAGARCGRAAPWIGCALLGLGQVGFAVDALGPSARNAGAIRELAWPVSWLAVGAIGLLATATGRVSRGFAVAGGVLLALVLAADWTTGLRHLENRAHELRGGEAQLPLYPVIGDAVLADPGPPIPDRLAFQALRSRDLLRRAAPVASLEIASFPEIPIGTWSAAGRFESIEPRGDTAFEARGLAFRSFTVAPPDLVLLTHRTDGTPELIFRLVRPRVGPEYEQLDWSATIPHLGFKDGDTVRAWGYFVRAGKVRALAGTLRFTAKHGFRREEATSP